MIRCYSGKLGSGKTLAMVNDAYPYLLHPEKYKFVTNTPIYVWKDNKHWYDVEPIGDALLEEQFYRSVNTLFILDEAQDIWPAGDMSAIPHTLQVKFRNLRKFGCSLIYTSTAYRDVHKRLREVTVEVCECNRKAWWLPWRFSNRYFAERVFEYDQVRSPEAGDYLKQYARFIYVWQLKNLYRSYKTLYVAKTSFYGGQGIEVDFGQPEKLGAVMDLYERI
jgi:hypothetical protein